MHRLLLKAHLRSVKFIHFKRAPDHIKVGAWLEDVTNDGLCKKHHLVVPFHGVGLGVNDRGERYGND